ncbi:MAG: GspH/FimT family pseudopilin [Thermoanaerobaculia bacterium]|nr:GspH/FimT family pseudopilin [Thermoanaerobaculia bacterium]
MPRDTKRGFTLIELLTVMAIIGVFVAVATPSWMSLRRRAAVRSAATEIRTIFHLVRSRAIARGANSGVKFTQLPGGEWQFAVYDDGDGDGVRNDDIRNGVDRVAQPSRYLNQQPQLASIALPASSIVDPDGTRIASGASAVQFNRSTICSFTPMGQATPGTIYLTDSAGEVYAVRVYGASAKLRLLRYIAATTKWEAR